MSLLSPENKIVHSLWIGSRLSLLEILTLKSFIYHGHIFYLWLYHSLENDIPEGVIIMDANQIIPEEKIFRYKYKNQFGHGKGSLGGFSDIFRYKLLYEYGGWWTDMDITCLKPLNFDQPYIFRTHQKLKLVGNLMKCPKKSILMKNCFENGLENINEENKDWHKPIQILVDEVKKQNLVNSIIEFTNPDSWKLIRKFLIYKKPIPEKWYAIHWVNEEWRRNKINKDYYRPESTYGLLMKKYNINNSKVELSKKITYWLNLTFLLSGLRQLPWYINRKIMRKT